MDRRKARIQLSKDNQGSTLLLVIIALGFLGILGALILSLTMTNIQMKAVDYQSRENFYGAETVLDELRAGLQKVSSDSMYEAYSYMLLNYSSITNSTSKTLKGEFDKKYVERLAENLTMAGSPIFDADDVAAYTRTYYYGADKIRAYLSDSNKTSLLNSDTFVNNTNILKIVLNTADNSSVNSVTLKDIKIRYQDEDGYETTITTDINLEAPNLNFETTSIYPEYTKYSLIADRQLLVQGGSGMSIQGDIYVGAGGITVQATNVTIADPDRSNGYNLKINGDMLITRGNITVRDYAKLFIGDATNKVDVWAENIATEGNTDGNYSSYINAFGNLNVSDDLTLGAKRSEVILGGVYNGYNYNKNNDRVTDATVKSEVNSQYSSAILINGVESSLDMSQVTSMTVAGRAFISRANDTTAGLSTADDIMTGESVSIKSNQTAYLVPDDYIWCEHNPVMQSELDAKGVGVKAVDITKFPASMSNLLTSRGYVEYHYQMGAVSLVYYYLEFKNQTAANQYFREYYADTDNQQTVHNNANQYLYDTGQGIKLSGSLLLNGNALVGPDGSLQLSGNVLMNPDNPGTGLLNMAKSTALEYKARQLELVSVLADSGSDEMRLVNKLEKPLFATIISQDGSTSVIARESRDAVAAANGFAEFGGSYYKKVPIDLTEDGSVDYYVYVINNHTEISLANIRSAFGGEALKDGIILVTGDLDVNESYRGLIISGGTIRMGAANVAVTAASGMVQDIFAYALDKEKGDWKDDDTKKFTHYFTQYKSAAASQPENIDTVDLSQYITYENWKKNAE